MVLRQCSERWFTDCTYLLHVCDDISDLQSELIILFFLIVKPNNCFSCVCVCVCVYVRMGGEGVGGMEERRGGEEKRRRGNEKREGGH